MNDWDDMRDDFERKPTRTTAKWTVRAWLIVVLVIALGGLTGAVIWYVKVGTSDVRGRGDAEVIKNEARNRIRAQEGFWVKYQGVVTADKNLTITAQQLKLRPDDLKLQTELVGQKMVCNDLVGQYNASAQKFTEREFRDAELPHQIDDTSAPDVDCKE